VTLAELAALADKKVPGFVHPSNHCPVCYGHGFVDGQTCYECDDAARVEDNSPAALAMAVMVCVAKARDVMLLSGYRASVAREVGPGPSYSDSRTITEPESIARALLTALLRAHGVVVPSE
jgi:hypothetical protein